MSVSLRVLAFGVVSGLVWSVAPGVLSGLFFSAAGTAVALAAAAITGIVVSFGLKKPLQKAGIWGCIGLGLLSLPFGAFVFGLLVALADILDRGSTAVEAFGGGPLMVALIYAIYSVTSVFAVILFPLAVLTTVLLRDVIHLRKGPSA
jgi:hypothetical protein